MGETTSSSAEVAAAIMSEAEGDDRFALGLNDVVVRRLFAVGLDLQAALALMGDHQVGGTIGHAIDELDQAIRDIRDNIFNQPPGTCRCGRNDAP